MKRSHYLPFAALVSALAVPVWTFAQQATNTTRTAPAAAGGASHPAQTVPKTKEGVTNQTPTAENLDHNAQRSHDRKTTSHDKAPKRAAQTSSSNAGSSAAPAPSGADVRTSAQVDQNHDGLMQPEEVEQSLGRGGKDTQTQVIGTPTAPATAGSAPNAPAPTTPSQGATPPSSALPEPVAPAPTTPGTNTPASPALPTSPATNGTTPSTGR